MRGSSYCQLNVVGVVAFCRSLLIIYYTSIYKGNWNFKCFNLIIYFVMCIVYLLCWPIFTWLGSLQSASACDPNGGVPFQGVKFTLASSLIYMRILNYSPKSLFVIRNNHMGPMDLSNLSWCSNRNLFLVQHYVKQQGFTVVSNTIFFCSIVCS